MKTFRVKESNLSTFTKMMKEMCPDKYKHRDLKWPDDDTYTHYVEVTLMSEKEVKEFYPDGGVYIEGVLYKVLGGEIESDELGYWWSFHKGEIIKCVKSNMRDGRDREVAEFSSMERNKRQVMPSELLRSLVKRVGD